MRMISFPHGGSSGRPGADASDEDLVERRRMVLDDDAPSAGRPALKLVERAGADGRPLAAEAFPPRRAQQGRAACRAARRTAASAGDATP